MKRLQAARMLAVALILAAFSGCAESEDPSNAAPVIATVTSSNVNPGVNSVVTLTCSASDPDGDNLSYNWLANNIEFGTDAATLTYTTPGVMGQVVIKVEVTDGIATVERNLTLHVGSEFNLLTAITDANYTAWTSDWIKDPTWVQTNRTELFIVDLRSIVSYNNGHITGAHSVSLANLATYVVANNTNDRPVAVVCDTGQIAAFATMGLRMLGHEAYCLKWGMAGWNDALAGPWDAGISDDYSHLMSNNSGPNLEINTWPVLSTGLSSGQAILQARVAAVFAEGLAPNNIINASVVMQSPGDFHIHNYWVNQDYEDIGHINGSYQITPGTLTTSQDLSAIHPTETNVLYCWSGQTSGFIGFYLNVLGYDLQSLRFGANALMHEDLPNNGWKWELGGLGLNYPVVTN